MLTPRKKAVCFVELSDALVLARCPSVTARNDSSWLRLVWVARSVA